MDTIFGRSSGVGKAGIVVYRISGPKSFDALKLLLNTKQNIKLTLAKLYLKKLYIPGSNELIDNAMVVYFKGPHSFTGEDVVELHLHGSIAINKLITEVLLNIDGLRVAEGGEFSKRAFLNGKFDLTSAEGLADLIDAETILQHKQAIKQYDGQLENLYEKWRKQSLQIIGFLEAYIDFPDEEIPIEILKKVQKIVDELKSAIKIHLNDGNKGERLRNGIKVSIIGAPNVGKSSLLNFFLQREAAIVSNIPGTTRDIIEGHLDIGGYPIILQDTAGIRHNSNDDIEQEGIKRSINAANNADIILLVVDVSQEKYESFFKEIIQNNNIILIMNKIDLIEQSKLELINKTEPIYISLKQKTGLDQLINKMIEKASQIAGLTEEPQITRVRHRKQLKKALEHLENFKINDDLILSTEDIRLGIRSLSNITGIITVEEILGEIFSNFCIGK